MAQKTQGIQRLLAAEKKAADLVSEARKRKTKRLKQAKEEAIAEIEQFRNECEQKFREKQQSEMGQDDFQQRINEETNGKLLTMGEQVEINKGKVISRMLELVNDIKPEIHENFRAS
ncbi:V-type proton ATPase subunit G-like [Hydractinia symbiolongicarpus]|uniref:V-type proton ATPase subunit G-like n=1 Tax=Hydractinia symbiolongicarpus TaxID=13093 RepID=UPI00254F6264|nr:V-type proton ATPase subunit G-like [Hydractinia symbiolongicarpus]